MLLGEPGDGVDLVEQDPAGRLLVEEVDPGEALAVQRLERLQRQLPHLGRTSPGTWAGISSFSDSSRYLASKS